MIKHVVWDTEVPPVSTYHWTQSDWDIYSDKYRASGYVGGRFDVIAWNAFIAEQDENIRKNGYDRLGLPTAYKPLKENVDAIKALNDRD